MAQPTIREQYKAAYRNQRVIINNPTTYNGVTRSLTPITNAAARDAAMVSFGDRRHSSFTGWVNWKRGVKFDRRQRDIDIARILFIDQFFGIAK